MRGEGAILPGTCTCLSELSHGRVQVTELLEPGSLYSCLHSTSPPTTEARYSIACGAAKAIEYLHRHGVVHRGFKSSKVLVAADGRVKISPASFETARLETKLASKQGSTASLIWTAPELLTTSSTLQMCSHSEWFCSTLQLARSVTVTVTTVVMYCVNLLRAVAVPQCR